MEFEQTSDMLTQMGAFQNNAAAMQREAFKADTTLQMMNSCADQCKLRYYESGITKDQPGVACFKNCVTKAYKLSSSSLQ